MCSAITQKSRNLLLLLLPATMMATMLLAATAAFARPKILPPRLASKFEIELLLNLGGERVVF